jgi:hypothetical protein
MMHVAGTIVIAGLADPSLVGSKIVEVGNLAAKAVDILHWRPIVEFTVSKRTAHETEDDVSGCAIWPPNSIEGNWRGLRKCVDDIRVVAYLRRFLFLLILSLVAIAKCEILILLRQSCE